MKEFYSTLLFLMVYFLSHNFVIALMTLAIAESWPCLMNYMKGGTLSVSTALKLGLLWGSLLLTWGFNSPVYFQYKTSLVYMALAGIALWAPTKWKEQVYQESLASTIDLPAFHILCPQVAKIFFIGGLINIMAVSYFSLAGWMVFKPFLAIGISASIMSLSYAKVLKHKAMAAMMQAHKD